jgi:hypothetical protein
MLMTITLRQQQGSPTMMTVMSDLPSDYHRSAVVEDTMTYRNIDYAVA